MIASLSIKNFRGIRRLKLENLGQINVIVGKNNSCKSTVLEALTLALGASNGPRILETSLQEILVWRGWYGKQAANDLFHKNSDSFGITLKLLKNKSGSLRIRGLNNVRIADKDVNTPLWPFFEDNEENSFIYIFLENNENKQNVKLKRDYNYFSIITHYEDENYISSINKSSIVSSEVLSKMMLSSVFYPEASFEFLTPLTLRKVNYIETLYSHAYEKMIISQAIKSLKLAYPDIKNFSPLLKYDKWILYVETSHGVYPYYVMGEGFKNILLISLVISLRKNGYLLIDSAEAFHHPKSLKIMLQTLINGIKSNNVQVFLTTHSLELIDQLLEEGTNAGIDGRIIYMKRKKGVVITDTKTFEEAMEIRNIINLDLRG